MYLNAALGKNEEKAWEYNDTGERHLHVTSLRTELAPQVQKPQI